MGNKENKANKTTFTVEFLSFSIELLNKLIPINSKTNGIYELFILAGMINIMIPINVNMCTVLFFILYNPP